MATGSYPLNSCRLLIKMMIYVCSFIWLKLGSKDPGECMQLELQELLYENSALEAIFNGFSPGA